MMPMLLLLLMMMVMQSVVESGSFAREVYAILACLFKLCARPALQLQCLRTSYCRRCLVYLNDHLPVQLRPFACARTRARACSLADTQEVATYRMHLRCILQAVLVTVAIALWWPHPSCCGGCNNWLLFDVVVVVVVVLVGASLLHSYSARTQSRSHMRTPTDEDKNDDDNDDDDDKLTWRHPPMQTASARTPTVSDESPSACKLARADSLARLHSMLAGVVGLINLRVQQLQE